MGDCWCKLGDVDKALHYFALAVDTNPKNPSIRVLRGQCYLAIGDHASAAEDLKAAYALSQKMNIPFQRELALKECAELEKQMKEHHG